MGGSVGLAVLATIAIDRTRSLLGSSHGTTAAAALTSGYARAFTLDALLGLCACAAAFIVPSLGLRQSAESPAGQIADAGVGGEEAAHPALDPAATARIVRSEPA